MLGREGYRGRGRGRGGRGSAFGGRGSSYSNGSHTFDGRDRGPARYAGRDFTSTSLAVLDQLIGIENEDNLVLKMTGMRNHLQAIVNRETIPDESVQKLVKIFASVSRSTLSPSVISVLSVLKGSFFLEKLIPIYLRVSCADKPEEFLNDISLSLLTLFEEFMVRFPSQTSYLSIDSLSMFVMKLRGSDELQRKLANVVSIRDEIERRILEQRDVSAKQLAVDRLPPDDFRKISTFPTAEDINRMEAPFLRPIVDRGAYQDGRNYLDVQFRLLKEDLVAPLREGIQELRSRVPYKERKHKLRVYQEVVILAPLFTRTGVTHRIKFSTTGMENFRWEKSKSLIFGSMLCLSKDEFKSVIFATVANRDPESLALGMLDVAFLDRVGSLDYIKGASELQMVESTTYFEAYRYVLDVLKEMDSNIPMGRYIVEAKVNVGAPRYLANNPSACYNLKMMLKNGSADPVRVLDSFAWPDQDKTIFNASQLEAVKHALTKEFVLIQGPPGTGKTFVGLRIAEALLENKRTLLDSQGDRKPILLVCYTNHALDQFLSGLVQAGFTNLLRVGGRASEEMKKFSLQKAREESLFGLHRTADDEDWWRAKREAFNRMNAHLKELEPGRQAMEAWISMGLKGKLVPFRELNESSCMSKEHSAIFESTEYSCKRLKISVFDVFLGLVRAPVESLSLLEADENASLPDKQTVELINAEGEGDILVERYAESTDYDRWSTQWSETAEEVENLVLVDKEGFRFVQQPLKQRRAEVKRQLLSTVPMSPQEAASVANPWALPLSERWRLYTYWTNAMHRKYQDGIETAVDQYEIACAEYRALEMQEDRRRFLKVDLIGMTTSCAARYYDALNRIRPCVVIVEEAAEVLEAHVVTALTAGAEHVILIGDHKQLRPNPSVYDLATKYNLSLSLFERMVINKLDCMTLNVQHRMRPQFARLLRHIYPQLENHPSVEVYKNIAGVEKNMYFINHQSPEEEIEVIRSTANEHEALFVKALCQYLIQQGYKPTEITILTGYAGQVQKIRSLMPRDQFEGVRITAVDNFQGEENEIILLSLVRSNDDERIGFWKADNRICVALSRAKKGMYVIGNFDLFSKCSLLWDSIVNDARSVDCFGNGLVLTCQIHANTKTKVCSEADFANAPDGGCMRPCDYRLPCGHVCPRACHPDDRGHVRNMCRKPCRRLCEGQSHACPATCHSDKKCPPCMIAVHRVVPSCGHTQRMPCSTEAARFQCKMPCTSKLTCGHICQRTCGETCTISCNEMVIKKLPCGHEQEIRCSDSSSAANCKSPCGQLLKCDHVCGGTCGACRQGRLHARCLFKCKRVLLCSHLCKETCTKDCPPCSEPCRNECPHSKCHKKCMEPCAPCMEPCLWSCPHQKCKRLCSEICDRQPCNEPCNRLLKCNHPCIGLCSEPCPSLCRVCDEKEVTSVFFGTEDEPDARFVQLTDCRHVLEVGGLDEWMSKDENDGQLKLKTCPRCTTPIRKSLRYMAIVKEILHDMNMVKMKIADQTGLEKLRSDVFEKVKRDFDLSRLFVHHSRLSSWSIFKNFLSDLDLKQYSLLDHDSANAIKLLTTLAASKTNFAVNLVRNQAALACSLKSLHAEVCLAPNRQSVRADLEYLKEYVMNPSISEEQLDDAAFELRRLTLTCRALSLQEGSQVSSKDRSDLDRMCGALLSRERLSEEALIKIEGDLKALRGTSPLTEEERVMVIKAVGLSKGHWFKCPNGHYYAIGECGGATQTGRCPDCKATIGGGSHRLAPGNAHAGEFDGSQHASWSEAANLQNFDPAELRRLGF